MSFPHLYECSVCGGPVKVTPLGEGIEPLTEFKCGHNDAVIWANRKVTLRGKGSVESMPLVPRTAIKLTLTVRQLLSLMTGRSV